MKTSLKLTISAEDPQQNCPYTKFVWNIEIVVKLIYPRMQYIGEKIEILKNIYSSGSRTVRPRTLTFCYFCQIL